MKAISLWQPWASLMAAGLKTIETRSWPANYAGPLAIHAAKRQLTGEEKDLLDDWIEKGLLNSGDWTFLRLPFGEIIAVVDLVRCERTTAMSIAPDSQNAAFGNFAPGRWAWFTRNARRLPQPIPYRGMQGLFWIPDSVMDRAEE